MSLLPAAAAGRRVLVDARVLASAPTPRPGQTLLWPWSVEAATVEQQRAGEFGTRIGTFVAAAASGRELVIRQYTTSFRGDCWPRPGFAGRLGLGWCRKLPRGML